MKQVKNVLPTRSETIHLTVTRVRVQWDGNPFHPGMADCQTSLH